MAQGLGWFSVGLGLAQLIVPRTLARTVGINAHPTFLRLLGIREIISGLGILTQDQPRPGLQSRVVGDAMDLALLGGALARGPGARGRLAAATAAVAGVTALDTVCAVKVPQEPQPRRIHVQKSITINASADDLYRFWRNLAQLPRIMNHLHSVEVTGDRTSRWVAKGPAGSNITWLAEITEDRPNELIGWRSLEGASVPNSGSVQFEPATGGRGTILRVELDYTPPAGQLGALVAGFFGENPAKQIAVDLHRFKQFVETGEIPTTEGQPTGRSRSTSKKFDEAVTT